MSRRSLNLAIDHISSLILLSGLSGAGKSSALDFFADAGFFVVDNLPVALFPSFIDYTRRAGSSKFKRVAVLLHIDSQERIDELMGLLKRIDRSARNLEIIFTDCKKDTIIRRYSETRRPHPAFNPETDKMLGDAIERERLLLFPLKEASNLVIDTSEMNVHDLKRSLRSFVETIAPDKNRAVRVNFVSFGFKYGLPIDCDLVADVRFLPNPHFIDGLREQTGCDQPVSDYVLSTPAAQDFITRYLGLLESLLPQYVYEGKSYLNVGIGCTGGKHRSVAIASELARRVNSTEYLISVVHRDAFR